jgi:hypothetical protein
MSLTTFRVENKIQLKNIAANACQTARFYKKILDLFSVPF